MLGILKNIVGNKSKKDDKIYQPYVDKVKSFEGAISALTNDQLRAKTVEFQEKIKAIIDTATNPGRIMGRSIFMRVCSLLHPSI